MACEGGRATQDEVHWPTWHTTNHDGGGTKRARALAQLHDHVRPGYCASPGQVDSSIAPHVNRQIIITAYR